jgi:NADP-dependent 3-hydroxy acid dehydrogenase YdfG
MAMTALQGKTVLLSGATSGLGRALAHRLAAEGCRLAVCGRDPAKLTKLVAELGLREDRLLARAFDLTDHAAAAGFADEALRTFGKVDVLINNAGANLGKAPLGSTDLKSFAAMLDLNCTAQLALTEPVWRAMSSARGGRIVNVVSSAALHSSAGISGYTASKGAFRALTGVMRREGKPLGIHVTGVYPGGIDTPFRTQARPDYLKSETVAEAIVGLLRLPDDAAVHELVLRPPVEDNFP